MRRSHECWQARETKKAGRSCNFRPRLQDVVFFEHLVWGTGSSCTASFRSSMMTAKRTSARNRPCSSLLLSRSSHALTRS